MSKEFPATLLEFERWFRTDEACRDYLIRLRWPGGFRCPQCGDPSAWRTARGLLHCTNCRRDTSVMVGTIFEGSHISLRLWFRAAWWMTNQKNGVSALGLQRALGFGSYRTALSCLHRLRKATVRSGREALTGAVEVDETFIGGYETKAQKSQATNKIPVMIAAEIRGEGTGRIRLRRITNRTSDSLLGFVKDVVAPKSTVVTDGLAAYVGLQRLGYDYRPRVPRNGRAEATQLLPRVHRTASLIKRWLMGTHQGKFTLKRVDTYLDEFAFRFNRRTSPNRGMLFYRLLQQAVITPR